MINKIYDLVETITWKHLALALLCAFTASSVYSNYKLLTVSSTTQTTADETHDSVEVLEEVAKSTREISQRNARTLEIVENATSPEAQAKNAEQTKDIIKQLDCGQQLTVQRFVDLHFPGEIVMSATCIEYFRANPPPPTG